MEMGWAGVKEEICRRAKDKQSSPLVSKRRFTSHDPENHASSSHASSQTFVASIQAVFVSNLLRCFATSLGQTGLTDALMPSPFSTFPGKSGKVTMTYLIH